VTGLFIAFEGGEGVGKSTQVDRLAGWLRDRGHDVVVTREPGGTELGAQVRDVLLTSTAPIAPRAELLLYCADRAQHVDAVIRPSLARGRVVISDRYVDSTLAYQGGGRDLPDQDVLAVAHFATGGLAPDLTVLLDLDPAVGLQRAARRSAPDRLEAAAPQFHHAVRTAFLALAGQDPDRYVVLDAATGEDEVADAVRAAVLPRLPAPARAATDIS
jgi:dTMP kinase